MTDDRLRSALQRTQRAEDFAARIEEAMGHALDGLTHQDRERTE